MNRVFKSAILVVMTIMLTMIGCKRENVVDVKNEGIMIVNGKEYLITNCVMKITSTNVLVFQNLETGVDPMVIRMLSDVLVSKTYQYQTILIFYILQLPDKCQQITSGLPLFFLFSAMGHPPKSFFSGAGTGRLCRPSQYHVV